MQNNEAHESAAMNLRDPNECINCISSWDKTQQAHLFDMEEVFGLEGDGHARHGDVILVAGTVADICAHGKCNWFGLPGGGERLARHTTRGDKCTAKTRMEVFRLSGTLRPSKTLIAFKNHINAPVYIIW